MHLFLAKVLYAHSHYFQQCQWFGKITFWYGVGMTETDCQLSCQNVFLCHCTPHTKFNI